jgi:hypothetical protein
MFENQHKANEWKSNAKTSIQVSSSGITQAWRQCKGLAPCSHMGHSCVHKLFPLYPTDIATLQVLQIYTVLQIFDSHLGGDIDKTISPRLLNDPYVSPLLIHKIQIFSQNFQRNPFRIKYASLRTSFTMLMNLDTNMSHCYRLLCRDILDNEIGIAEGVAGWVLPWFPSLLRAGGVGEQGTTLTHDKLLIPHPTLNVPRKFVLKSSPNLHQIVGSSSGSWSSPFPWLPFSMTIFHSPLH